MGTSRGVSLVGVALVILFFFLPWVSVSCGGSYVVEVSGYEMAAGKEIGFGERTEPDVVMYLVPLAAVAAAFFALIAQSGDQMTVSQIVCGLIGLGVMAAKLLVMEDNRSDLVTISPELGLYGTAGGFTLILLAAFLVPGKSSRDQESQSQSTYAGYDRRKPIPQTKPPPRSVNEVDQLLKELNQHDFATARARAATLLGEVKEPDDVVIAELRHVAAADPVAFVRERATESLIKLGFDESASEQAAEPEEVAGAVPESTASAGPTDPGTGRFCPNGHGPLPQQSKYCHRCGVKMDPGA